MAADPINPTLRVPRATASKAFLEIARNIRASPILGSRIRTWVIPGLAFDLPALAFDPDFVMPESMCPALMLWPIPRDGQPLTNVEQQATLNVRCSLFVATADPLDAMDLYEPILAAVSPESVADGQTLRSRLQPITGWSGQVDIEQPAVTQFPSTGAPILVCEGTVSTRYRIPSY